MPASIAALCALAACPALRAQAAADHPELDFAPAWSEVVAALHRGCETAGVVGASLMFVRGDTVLGSETHGFADRATGRAVDRDTIFHWASCTKTLTGIAVMQLRDRGKLRLDQPIVELVPELRAVHDEHGKIEDVTLRHLLTHSAGFRGATWPWGGDKPWHPHEPTSWSQLVAMMPYTEIEFVPGSRFSYSSGQTFYAHTGGQKDFVTFFYVHPASGTGALGAFNTGSAGPVMAEVQRLCMERLSAPMAPHVEHRQDDGLRRQ